MRWCCALMRRARSKPWTARNRLSPLAGAGGATQRRVRTSRHPLPVCRPRRFDRPGARTLRAPAHRGRVLRFLDHATRGYRRKAIHIILDNLAAHKTAAVQAWLAAHPRVHFHYTPTYSSWLNQVELWLAKIERDCIARDIFTSTRDLKRKLLTYIDWHNKEAKPFLWTYNNPKRRIRVTHQ